MELGFPLETILVFVVLTVGGFFLDMYAHRADKVVPLKSAILWSLFWIGLAIAFGFYLEYRHGETVANLYFTGYALEKALSVDNLFVFMALFSWFAIPDHLRHRVLYWGIVGAIVFRAIFVAIGTSLLAFGPWVELLFAAIVAYTAVLMLKANDDDDELEDYSEHVAYKFVRKIWPAYPKLAGNRFFLNRKEVETELAKPENNKLSLDLSKSKTWVTPLFLCLAVVEVSDVMFAFDSVPAVIAVSREPLIVYSAMMFAILGLRTMYFVLEAMKRYLVHLEKAVIALLFFIAAKLALSATDHMFGHGYKIQPDVSLYVVLGVLALGVVASVFSREKAE
ncbi:TerC/Alx family metal homeostasis membrane protein [Gayadomonas joobiniege]|uniref:TerC/Alx family metal homeostasis membrane protein n=1 Tax=Gayadomonas joobiniege TaxID=1234606 RepID=UPI000377F6E3|nr:TerC/Alx family metal homeostasis membrane protein [Gayadomonas joobiniege]